VYPVSTERKQGLFLELLGGVIPGSVLVFTRTKHRANRLADFLDKNGVSCARIHGNRSQSQRSAALAGFKQGKFKVLVATDIAARGIDVSRISHVINYDMPDTVDAYTHRIGRTGRASRTGDAFTFVTLKDRAFVWDIERALGETLERRTLGDFDYSVPAPAGSGGSGGPRLSARRPDAMKVMGRSSTQRTLASMPLTGTVSGLRNGSRRLSRKTPIFSSSRSKSRRPH